MGKSNRRLSDAERAERRREDRERLQVASEALLSSQGWQRWVRARAVFHCYCLIILSGAGRRCMRAGSARR